MRLICSEYGLDLEIKENRTIIFVVESPKTFACIIGELLNQIGGEPGKFILSEKDTIKTIGKEAEIVINPFVIDCNEKKILQKLYQEMLDEANDSMIEKTTRLQGQMITYIEELIQRMPYPLAFDVEENMVGLFKLCHVEIDDQGDTLVEKIINYIKMLKQFCNIHIILFVNLKLYLTKSELEELYKCAFYEKISLLLLENSLKEKIESESICILDKDLCIIEV